jgi:hypothetical protein
MDLEAGTCRGGDGAMRENREKWMELCGQAADEQDPKKLAVLILQINYILEAKELRLTGKVPAARSPVEGDSVNTESRH